MSTNDTSLSSLAASLSLDFQQTHAFDPYLPPIKPEVPPAAISTSNAIRPSLRYISNYQPTHIYGPSFRPNEHKNASYMSPLNTINPPHAAFSDSMPATNTYGLSLRSVSQEGSQMSSTNNLYTLQGPAGVYAFIPAGPEVSRMPTANASNLSLHASLSNYVGPKCGPVGTMHAYGHPIKPEGGNMLYANFDENIGEFYTDYDSPQRVSPDSLVYRPDFVIRRVEHVRGIATYLFIFNKENRNLGYKYILNQQSFYCTGCKKSKRHTGAKLVTDENGEHCIHLLCDEHVCDEVLYAGFNAELLLNEAAMKKVDSKRRRKSSKKEKNVE